jgi:hypothetical protein
MDVSFDIGDPQKPRGHALAYFRTRSEPDKVYATYIIVLPITIDFAKYVPPFLASHLGSMPNDLSAFSLPPVPEEVGSYEELQRLAGTRDDDLLYAGTMLSFELPEMMEAVGEVVRYYSQAWSDNVKPAINAPTANEETEGSSPGVNEVLYSLMSEQDRLADLSKLVGKLRFAVEGNDHETGTDMEEEIKLLGRFLPEHYNIPNLLQAVMDSSARGAQLAQLYLDRCYKLSNHDDAGALDLEERIESLKTSS